MAIKTLLLIPPKYELNFPPLATPALLGFLKSRRKEAEQFDSNQEYALHLMNKVSVGERSYRHAGFLYYVMKALKNRYFMDRAQTDVYYAKALADPSSAEMYHDWSDSSYAFAENLLDADYLERFLEDEKENTFLQYYQESKLGERLCQKNPDLLGISIIGPSQIIPALTLAKYLKTKFPDCPKILIGGQWCTLFLKQIFERPDLTSWIDFVIRGEGETPLLNLIEALEGNAQINNVPNLTFADQGKWRMTLEHTKENLRELPAPDFSGLLLDQYNSFNDSTVGLTYETSRECYWNRCTYCVDLPLPHDGYRIKPVPRVVDEIEFLYKKHRPDYIIFSDPAIAPARLRDISLEMIRRGLKIPFWCFARLESNFTKEIFEITRKAGCHEIDFGMETANQRLMDFVDKGTDAKEVSRIVRECAESEIRVVLQVIFRFPTETVEEGLETVNFLVEHKVWISAAAVNIYYLTRGNFMFDDPERFQMRIPEGQPKFRFFLQYDPLDSQTMTREQAEDLVDLHYRLTHQAREFVPINDKMPGLAETYSVSKDPIGHEIITKSKPILENIVDVLDCLMELPGGSVETSVYLLEDGSPVGFLTRKQADELRKYLGQQKASGEHSLFRDPAAYAEITTKSPKYRVLQRENLACP